VICCAIVNMVPCVWYIVWYVVRL